MIYRAVLWHIEMGLLLDGVPDDSQIIDTHLPFLLLGTP